MPGVKTMKVLKSLYPLLVIPVVAALMQGCSTVPIENVTPVEKSHYSEGALPPQDASQVPPYVLGNGDVLKIVVLRHPELSGSVRIGSHGELKIPNTDDMVIASGKTVSDLRKELTQLVEKYVKSEPVVVLDVEIFNSKFIYILGAVAQPGEYALKDRAITLRDAIFLAGMPAGDADLKKVVVVNPDFDEPTATKINFARIYYGGHMKYNIVLNEGDIVFVPYTMWSKTVAAIDRIATPLAKTAGGLAAGFYIKDQLEDDDSGN